MACLSCKDSGTEPVIPVLRSISGKIENWTLGDTMVVRANYDYFNYHLHTLVLTTAGESVIDMHGNFSILVSTIPDSALGEYGWEFPGVIIDDTTVGTASVAYLSIYSRGSANMESNILGRVWNQDLNDTGGITLSIQYIYANKPFQFAVDTTFESMAGDTIREIIYLNFSRGWNK